MDYFLWVGLIDLVCWLLWVVTFIWLDSYLGSVVCFVCFAGGLTVFSDLLMLVLILLLLVITC